MGFSLYCLFRPRLFELRQEWAAYPFGFVAGILGGAYNSNGPPVVIYGTVRKWPPDCFRANLQGYFFPANLIIIASHGLGGLWTPAVGWYFLLSLPAVLLSMWIGNHLNRMIPQGQFDRYIHIILILIGALLFIRTVMGLTISPLRLNDPSFSAPLHETAAPGERPLFLLALASPPDNPQPATPATQSPPPCRAAQKPIHLEALRTPE